MESILTKPCSSCKPNLLVTPEDHAAVLHPFVEGNMGLVTVAHHDGRRWVEQHVPIPELPYAVRFLAGAPASYLSQHRFRGPRRITHLWQLGALWADLDYHKVSAWQGQDPQYVYDFALDLLADAGIPAPTFAIATGRGLALVWLHHAVPRGALPRWNACQNVIFQTLRPLGADPAAIDAARVLRLVGSVNERSGKKVIAISPVGHIWDFDALADEILPLTRNALSALRIQRATRGVLTPHQRANPPRQGLSIASLWEGRLTDLQTLLDLRWWGTLPPGQRDTWLFLAVTAMSWLVDPQMLQREAWALAKQVAGWSGREAATRLHAIVKRAHMAAQGQHVEWQGHPIDPRYRFRNETIIEWLHITPEEQRHLRIVIDRDEKRRRHRETERQRKRHVGETRQSRAEYLASAVTNKREEAIKLKEQGMPTAAIARTLGVSRQRIQQYLKQGCKGSVPLYGGVASAKAFRTGSPEGLED